MRRKLERDKKKRAKESHTKANESQDDNEVQRESSFKAEADGASSEAITHEKPTTAPSVSTTST